MFSCQRSLLMLGVLVRYVNAQITVHRQSKSKPDPLNGIQIKTTAVVGLKMQTIYSLTQKGRTLWTKIKLGPLLRSAFTEAVRRHAPWKGLWAWCLWSCIAGWCHSAPPGSWERSAGPSSSSQTDACLAGNAQEDKQQHFSLSRAQKHVREDTDLQVGVVARPLRVRVCGAEGGSAEKQHHCAHTPHGHQGEAERHRSEHKWTIRIWL